MAEKSFFGPLTLHQKTEKTSVFKSDEAQDCVCVLCDNEFCLPADEQQLLTHLFMQHRLVIADENQIADLKGYLTYWKLRFRDESLAFFCTTMLLDDKPDGTKSKDEEYFLLSDVLPEDKELRSNLQQTRLEKLLQRHQFEREDENFDKECLFCRFSSTGTRANYLNHLYEKHNFHIAKPENLVFIDELIDTIAQKLDKLVCIYCEKVFKDRTILKEHMRKKGHKRINADNKEYDKYYLVNYVGEKKHVFKAKPVHKKRPITDKAYENDNDNDSDSDPEWSQWTEQNGPLITCLLCKHGEEDFENILDHMERCHDFSFTETTANLNFYHKIKIVNFMRRQIHMNQCLTCDTKFDDCKNLEKHMKESNHMFLSKERWDQPEYFFSTYEDDLFLCFIQDEDESWWSSDEQDVERRNSMSDTISKEMAMSVLSD